MIGLDMLPPQLSHLAAPSADAHELHTRLQAKISAAVQASGGWLSFARYMELALYAPGLGYYSAGSAKLGSAGDFVTAPEISGLFARMAYGSVAGIVILPMQDVLNLDESARMNTPASSKNNWGWRLLPGQLSGPAEANLREWTGMYNRE